MQSTTLLSSSEDSLKHSWTIQTHWFWFHYWLLIPILVWNNLPINQFRNRIQSCFWSYKCKRQNKGSTYLLSSCPVAAGHACSSYRVAEGHACQVVGPRVVAASSAAKDLQHRGPGQRGPEWVPKSASAHHVRPLGPHRRSRKTKNRYFTEIFCSHFYELPVVTSELMHFRTSVNYPCPKKPLLTAHCTFIYLVVNKSV